MLAIDGEAKVTKFEITTRVEGLLPSEKNPEHLIQGNWTAQVDIRTGESHGVGEVYLGNANTPSSTWGFIFRQPIPFNPDLELGFVFNSGEEEVIWERDYVKPGYLVYAEPSVITELGRVHYY